jgi:ArsR family transcriptional regulator
LAAAVEDIFKALGDPTRVKIVRMLAENGEMCVCNIMEELGMTQPAVSHHLAALKHAGLVNHRKQGQWVHYSLCCPILSETVQSFLDDVLDRSNATPSDAGVCR